MEASVSRDPVLLKAVTATFLDCEHVALHALRALNRR